MHSEIFFSSFQALFSVGREKVIAFFPKCLKQLPTTIVCYFQNEYAEKVNKIV